MKQVYWPDTGTKGLMFQARCVVNSGDVMAILAYAIYLGREPSTKRDAEDEVRSYFATADLKDVPLENVWEYFPDQTEDFYKRVLVMMRKWWPALAADLEDDQ